MKFSNEQYTELLLDSTTCLRVVSAILSLLSNTVPRIVIIVGLILFWNAPWMRNMTVCNTAMMLALTCTVAFLPYTVQYVKANFQQIDISLFHAAQVCGAKSGYITRRILFPLVRPGLKRRPPSSSASSTRAWCRREWRWR
ncbi:MAG: ABC transporter permease subunit [Spirochaetaceae bacterium]|nr:MAG: ABC transporter permease subunit [Spirochaetaceae bacterium]